MQRFKEILRRLLFPGAAVALYTFYTTIMAVVNLVRDRKSGSPVMAAARGVNLARGAGLGAIARNRDADTVQRREQGRVFPPGHDRLDRRGRVRPRDGHGPLYGDPRHKADPKAACGQRSVPR